MALSVTGCGFKHGKPRAEIAENVEKFFGVHLRYPMSLDERWTNFQCLSAGGWLPVSQNENNFVHFYHI